MTPIGLGYRVNSQGLSNVVIGHPLSDAGQVLREASLPRIHAAVLRTLLLLVSAAAFELPPALLSDARAWALVSMRSAAGNAGSAELPTKDLFHIHVRLADLCKCSRSSEPARS